MSPTLPITCTHERGRGTTVCLRCRHDEWQATQRRRQQMLMRVLGLGSLVGIIGVAGAAGAITLRENKSGATEASSGNVALQQEGRPVKVAASRERAVRSVAPIPAPRSAVTPAADAKPASAPVVAPSPVVAPPPSSKVNPGLVLVAGRTTLGDSIFAVRSGDSVTVNFDTKGNRTRRADKFEGMIRLTLPMVYGRQATTALDSVPEGSLLPSRDVLGALTTQGLHLTLDNGVKIGVWPQTREGTDGPLVVAYLVVVER